MMMKLGVSAMMSVPNNVSSRAHVSSNRRTADRDTGRSLILRECESVSVLFMTWFPAKLKTVPSGGDPDGSGFGEHRQQWVTETR